MGVGADGDLCHHDSVGGNGSAVGEGADKVEVRWVRGYEDKRARRRLISKHQRGNFKADANCTAIKRRVESK